MKTGQNVVIKGTKDGLTLQLNDKCAYNELIEELVEKLDTVTNDGQDALITVTVQTGNRYVTEEDKEVLKNVIRKRQHLVVEDIKSNVITLDEAVRWKEEEEIVSYAGRIRSGQVLEVPGNLLLVGDVNPGGTIKAGGSIYVMGALKGVAHAGCYGNDRAVIAAAKMMPTQLRISNHLTRSPDRYDEEEITESECAFINEADQLVIDRLQVLKYLRPDISTFKGGF
ncbi:MULTISPECIES: septum site-determining protein MinC [Bacillaceae]|uniref:Probable septum site-determining protein MinC n=1 Tax=Domibacillus aminovorans TaxID=29332 RepID=A0A177LB64_9BACI|nr:MULTISPECIES: septum site-determining protein MinC [Bacillaceae]OAH56141.1 septum formation inhibitor [Domibacillus aminovorans]OAH62724.1 septum formation inhibitor [Domibacillus aminovorans]